MIRAPSTCLRRRPGGSGRRRNRPRTGRSGRDPTRLPRTRCVAGCSWPHGNPATARRRPASWTEPDLARVRTVRDALREVLDAVVEDRSPLRSAVDTVNGALAEGNGPRLDVDGPTLRVGHEHGRSEVGDALAALASPIVAELGSGRPDRFRTCANETCRWSFYDTSPTGRRRWCDMKTCGNRAKAARHRERAKGIEIIESVS